MVRILLARVVTLGIHITLVLLDRGCYSVRVVHDLITAEFPFIMPAVKHGKKSMTPEGPTGTYALAAAKQSHWTTYTVKNPHEGHVAFDLAVICYNTRGQRGRHQREALLYATWGVTQHPLHWIRATYRGVSATRFRTSSRNPVLRNVWVWLHAEVMAEPRRGATQLRPDSLRFARLLLYYRLLRNVPVYRDLYDRAQAFGIVFNY